MRFLTAINDHMDEDLKHYITIFMGCCLPGTTKADGGVIMPEAQVSFPYILCLLAVCQWDFIESLNSALKL